MHTRGYQLVPQLLLKHIDSLPVQYRHIEHLHSKKSILGKKGSFVNFDVFCPVYLFCLCLDSAYVDKSTGNRAFTEAF